MLKQIDLTNLNHITFIIILIIIFFCIIYLFKVNKQNASIEGFAQYDVKPSDTVKLDSLDNVIVGGNGESLITTLNDAYAEKGDYLNYKTTITNGMIQLRKDITDSMNNIKTNIESSISTFRTTITATTDASISSFENRLNTLKTNLETDITKLTSNVTIAAPPLTVVAFYNNVIPTGWQLCDGSPFTAMDGTRVYYKITSSGDPVELNTPDLRGRMILGANVESNRGSARDSSGHKLTNTKICDYGGAEKHTLTIAEMPTHNHGMKLWQACFKNGGCDNRQIVHPEVGHNDDPFWMQKTGGNLPHNNMPPCYVLNYIIKKPLLGGDLNAIIIRDTNILIPSPTPKF